MVVERREREREGSENKSVNGGDGREKKKTMMTLDCVPLFASLSLSDGFR